MDVRTIQEYLNLKHTASLRVDGVFGKASLTAVDKAVGDKPLWSDDRKLVAIEQMIYRDAGIEAGTIDGLVGEQTRYARTVWEARKAGDNSVETWRDADESKPPPLPPIRASVWPHESGVEKFFSPVGSHQVNLMLPFSMRIAWEPDKVIARVSCHEKVRDAFDRIWRNTLAHYGLEELRRLRLDVFGGCLNVRKKRGGSAWSMHSWGIAWDVDPDRNQLKWGQDLALLDDAPYAPFWQIVEAEGGVSLGRARGYDFMHFQFARL